MENFIKNELVCLRASEPVGSDRYNELSKAIQWVTEHGDKEEKPKAQTDNNHKYAITTIQWKEDGKEEEVIFGLRGYDEKNDNQIFFYSSEDEFEELKHFENGQDFVVVGCTVFCDRL